MPVELLFKELRAELLEQIDLDPAIEAPDHAAGQGVLPTTRSGRYESMRFDH